MSEEFGSVVVKVSDEIAEMLSSEETSYDAMLRLGQSAGFSKEELDVLHNTWSKLETKNGFTKFDFGCENWKQISQLFVTKGSDIEWFARISDEYGAVDFFLLNEAGERIHFSFDQDSDLSDEDWYLDEVNANIAKWKSALPDELQKTFPDFLETEDLVF